MSTPLSSGQRAAMSRGISGGEAYYEFATRGLESKLPGSRILDLGCGTGGFGRFLTERWGTQAHGVDAIRHEGFNSTGYSGFQLADLDARDAQALPGGWDFVFALGLIEYLTAPGRFIRFATTLLKPGGRLIVTAPNPASLRSLLAVLRSGEFSAFKESSNPASITPVLAGYAARMLREAELRQVEISFSGCGVVPGAGGLHWPRPLARTSGRWFSDDYRAVGVC